ILACGALAVAFYRRRSPYSAISLGKGARLGALSGIISLGIITVWIAITTLFYGTETLRKQIIDAIDLASKKSFFQITPQQLEYFKSPEGLAVVLIASLFTMLLLFIVVSAIGGALGAAWARRRGRQ